MTKCVVCGKEYETDRGLRRYHYQQEPYHAPDDWSRCPTCDKPFKTVKNMSIHHSKEHGEPAYTNKCDYCGDEYRTKPSNEDRFCSPRCWYDWKKEQYHGDWYQTAEYKQWRQDVFERDDYTCQDCGSVEAEAFLHSHHIDSPQDEPDRRAEVSNGVTVCTECHIDRHKKRGDDNAVQLLRSRFGLRKISGK